MIDKQSILNTVGRFLSPQKAQALSQAFDIANQITDATRDPVEAFRRAGVTPADLASARNLINNPMAGFVLNRFGVKKDDILAGINRAEELLSGRANSPLVEQAPTDELSSLRENLARVR